MADSPALPAIIVVALFLFAAPPSLAQVPHAPTDHMRHAADSARALSLGAMAVGLLTRASPAALGRTVTEGYLTQPMLMAAARTSGRRLQALVTLNLEGLTLERGEINLGSYGEGYVDRRHPHTYLHEAMVGVEGAVRYARVSLFAGKGVVPFGSDDPMVRPFVKYPTNHHLAQLLERAMVIGAIRLAAFTLEAGRFNGDEPEGPADMPNGDRALDSWSSRLTVASQRGLELSGSVARVQSPEFATGQGLDQKKEHAAIRLARPGKRWRYALVEMARTRDHRGQREFFRFTTSLAETAWALQGLTVALRAERTERPEESRLENPYRSVRPLLDFGILGKTRWETLTAYVESPALLAGLVHLKPFGEASWHRARALVTPTPYDPLEFYGAGRLWMVSIGVRVHAGRLQERMGRYGAADTVKP